MKVNAGQILALLSSTMNLPFRFQEGTVIVVPFEEYCLFMEQLSELPVSKLAPALVGNIDAYKLSDDEGKLRLYYRFISNLIVIELALAVRESIKSSTTIVHNFESDTSCICYSLKDSLTVVSNLRRDNDGLSKILDTEVMSTLSKRYGVDLAIHFQNMSESQKKLLYYAVALYLSSLTATVSKFNMRED